MYDELVPRADQEGRSGDVQWNFEKFLVDGSGTVVARFDPTVVPDDPRVTERHRGGAGLTGGRPFAVSGRTPAHTQLTCVGVSDP